MWGLFGRKGRIADEAPAGWLNAPGVVLAAKQSRLTMSTGSGDMGTARNFSVYRVTVRAELPGGPVEVTGSVALAGAIQAGQRTAIFYKQNNPARHWKLDRWATDVGHSEWMHTPEGRAHAASLMPEALRREMFSDPAGGEPS